MPVKRVFLSLGSNLGEREQNLERALELLEANGISILKKSSIYETEPQDLGNQPWFLNIAVECQTSHFPLQLLNLLLQTERQMGRERKPGLVPKGPRLIDIDLVLYGRFQINSPKLTVPHLHMLHRRFVLTPLVEIDPLLRHPVSGRLLRDHLRELRGQIVRLHHK